MRLASRQGLALLLAALLLPSTGCGAAAAAPPDAPPEVLHNAPFLWKIHGTTVDHYLMGSVHLLPDAATLPPELDLAYAAATTVIFETDLTALEKEDVQAGLLDAGRAADGLQAEIGKPLYAKTRAHLAKAGMPETFCDPFQAWFCALALELFDWQKAGFGAENGIDLQLNTRALADGKLRRWFEAPAAHLALLTGMSPAESRDLLVGTLDETSADGDPAAVYKAWREDDVATIAREVAEFKRESPSIYNRLLRNRNLAWQPMLKQLMAAPTPQLLVVGAAHCVGPDGLIDALRAAGYIAVAVPATPKAPDATAVH